MINLLNYLYQLICIKIIRSDKFERKKIFTYHRLYSKSYKEIKSIIYYLNLFVFWLYLISFIIYLDHFKII